MIEVVATLYPRGDRTKPREIGRATLANDGSGTASRGNYSATFGHKGRLWKTSEVKGFHRQSKNVWHLLYECLHQALGGL